MLYSDIVGQEDIKSYLVKSILQGNVSHCYIFEGPKDVGKYDLAMVFAQSLLCGSFEGEPCNECDNCRKAMTMNHPDIHVFGREEKSIKRETIDEIVESIYNRPYEAKRKVYVIDNCQDMTSQAANTFLKTLEEPPGDAVMILLTTNSNMMLPTIVSRCQLIKFRNAGRTEIETYLKDKYNAGSVESYLAACYSKGILNKAVNILTGKDDILNRRREIIDMLDRIIKSDKSVIYEYENYFDENKDNIDEILEIMMIWFRDVTFFANGVTKLCVNRDMESLLSLHNSMMKHEDLSALIIYLQSVSSGCKYNVNYKLLIDQMLLRIREEFSQ